MIGICNTTGKKLGGTAHVWQSIRDILTTPIGSRVMRRSYGSRIFQLIDAPLNPETIIDLFAATAEAILKWEPRFKLESVSVSGRNDEGKVRLLLTGTYLPDGRQIKGEIAV